MKNLLLIIALIFSTSFLNAQNHRESVGGYNITINKNQKGKEILVFSDTINTQICIPLFTVKDSSKGRYNYDMVDINYGTVTSIVIDTVKNKTRQHKNFHLYYTNAKGQACVYVVSSYDAMLKSAYKLNGCEQYTLNKRGYVVVYKRTTRFNIYHLKENNPVVYKGR